MIPRTAIHFNPDGTAWWVLPDDLRLQFYDKPCDTCGGHGDQLPSSGDWRHCPDCIDGRYTFDIEVEADYFIEPMHHHVLAEVHRVSVVPGMVLPIVEDVGPVPSETHIRITGGGVAWLAERIEGGGWRHTEITLPSAKPGMWALLLAVSS